MTQLRLRGYGVDAAFMSSSSMVTATMLFGSVLARRGQMRPGVTET